MFKQILHTFFTKIITSLFNLAIAILISNFLGAEGKGEQGLILATITIIIIFSNVVGSGALAYLIPRYQLSILIIPSLIWLIIIITFFSFLIPVLNIVPDVLTFHVSILCGLSLLNELNINILYAHQRIRRANQISLIQIGIIFISLILFLIIFKIQSIDSYIYSLYFGYSISLLINFISCFKYYKATDFIFPLKKYIIGFRNLLRYGIFNQLDILAQMLSFRFSYYVLNYYSSTAEVGIFSNAVSIIESIWLISRSIDLVQHSRIVNSRDKSYSINISITLLKLTIILATFAIIPLILLPSSFYQFLFGNEFGQVRQVILYLSPGVLFFSTSFIISSYFSGIGKLYLNSISSFTGLAVTLAITFPLIKCYGIKGAALAATISYFVTTIIKFYFFIKKEKVNINQLKFRKVDYLNLKQELIAFKNSIIRQK